MTHTTPLDEWRAYVERERALITARLTELGYTLDSQQPHTQGERYLMRAVTTENGRKVILFGTHPTHGRVVIKASSEPGGIKELQHERQCREVLHAIHFAYSVFSSPRELLFETRGGYALSIQEYIVQEKSFLERPLKEQFTLALSAFKAQEGTHATTYAHRKLVSATFGSRDARGYLESLHSFSLSIAAQLPTHTSLLQDIATVEAECTAQSNLIEQYSGFLTHTDFVPHNIRIKENTMYLLDHSSLRFGNKYEGWARFLNFMTLYNPELESALVEYVRLNRISGEVESLHLMRMYRLVEIIRYYVGTLSVSEGPLLELNTARVEFWSSVLHSLIQRERVHPDVVESYKQTRDALRSPDEKVRQQGLH